MQWLSHLDVVHKDHAQMGKAALREDLNELGLVCAEPALACRSQWGNEGVVGVLLRKGDADG